MFSEQVERLQADISSTSKTFLLCEHVGDYNGRMKKI